MNKERILALADLIEKQPHVDYSANFGFNMEDYRHDCGTPSCIAGWATALAHGLNEGNTPIEGSAHCTAVAFLSINSQDGMELFQPRGIHPDEWGNITPAHAAFTLRHLAETGKVDWSAYEAVRGASLNEGTAR